MTRPTRLALFAALVLPVQLPGCDPVMLRGAEPASARVALPALRPATGPATDPFPRAGTKAVVVAVLSFKCPLARDYFEPLSAVAAEYGPKGVAVVGVVPNETPEEVARQAAEFKAAFPVFADRGLAAADALKATHTPEVFVLDARRVVRYRGRVDDKFGARLKANPETTRHDLRSALDEVLAGKAVSVPRTPCVGCEIARPKAAPAGPAAVTFHRDVLPILQARCQECHRPGEAGPFPLVSYDDAATWAADIKEFTGSRRMPPWKPTGGLPLAHDRRLPAAEIATLAAWADAGAPEGNKADAPAPRAFTPGWALGEPDLVLTVEDDFHLAARGPDHYRCFVLPTGLTEDRMLVGYEVRPGDASVVHHVLNYFDTTGTARRLDREARGKAGIDRGPGYESPMGIGFEPKDAEAVGGLGGWAPGMGAQRAPAGTGHLLPKGSDVVLQVHYHRTGKPATDRTRIGLYFAKAPAGLKRLKTLRVPGLFAASDDFAPFTRVPAGRAGYRVVGKVVLDEPGRLYAAMPHLHMLGSKVRITMTRPGGREEVVVAVDEWDYAWQEAYRLAAPVDVPAGTVFAVEAEFDNTARNPLNPHRPPQDVARGEGTTDEMLFGFLGMTTDGPGGAVRARPLTDPAAYRPTR